MLCDVQGERLDVSMSQVLGEHSGRIGFMM